MNSIVFTYWLLSRLYNGRNLRLSVWGCNWHRTRVTSMHLDLVSRWKEGVKAYYQLRVSFEQWWHSTDDSWSVNAGEKEHTQQLNNLLTTQKNLFKFPGSSVWLDTESRTETLLADSNCKLIVTIFSPLLLWMYQIYLQDRQPCYANHVTEILILNQKKTELVVQMLHHTFEIWTLSWCPENHCKLEVGFQTEVWLDLNTTGHPQP